MNTKRWSMGVCVTTLAALFFLATLVGCSQPDNSITSVEAAQNAKIGVMTGTTGEAIAALRFPHAQVKSFDDVMDAVAAMKSGQLDAVITSYPTCVQVAKKNPEFSYLQEPLQNEETAIALKKGNDALLADVNRIIAELKANGSLADMKARWFKPDLSPYEEKNHPLPTTGKVLKIGVSATREPFSFIDKDGRVTGHDGELARLLGARLQRPVEFFNMKFMALIPSLQSGKVDMLVTGMTATTERKKSVDFTQPYFDNAQLLLVKKPPAASADAGSAVSSIYKSFHSNLIQENRYLLILDGLKTTVVMSVFATILGTLLGALVCFMRMSTKPLLTLPARIYIAILRGTPVLVVLMLIYYVVFASVNIDPVLVAIIAFGMNFAAYAAEIFRTGIEGVDKGQSEAGIAMGFTKVNTFLWIILPQTIRRILPVYKGEFISLVKMTSIVGYIAVQDLTKASDIIRSRTFDAFFPLVMVAILYFLIAWFLMQFLDHLERVTDPKYKREKGTSS
jgi:polar amino acid transport system substrate-binding protein